MIKAEGHGQSECYQCKKEGKYSLTWTSFLYRTEKDNYKNLYCYECANKLEKENLKNDNSKSRQKKKLEL